MNNKEPDKKLFLALFLSLVVVAVYPYIMEKLYPTAPQTPIVVDKEAGLVVAGEETPPPPPGVPATPATGAVPALAPSPVTPRLAEGVEETLTTVETPLFRAVFTNIGGGVKSWQLKDYRVMLDPDSEPVDLALRVGERDLLGTRLPGGGAIPFETSKDRLVLSDTDSGELLFTWTSPEGVTVEKKYLFTGADYTVESSLKVVNRTDGEVSGSAETDLAMGFDRDAEGASYYHSGPLTHIEEEVDRQDADVAANSGSGPLKWIGVESKYFLQALIPAGGDISNWSTTIPSVETATVSLAMPFALRPGGKAEQGFTAYIGPKEYTRLLARGAGVEEAIEFGFLSVMAKPVLRALNFFQRFIGNYGIAIILLTCIIKVIFYPLTKHSLTSMKQLQRVQPQMNALKERYKDDKEKLNKELMELYKRYKVNPLGGCLPVLLQIPVFIALYEVLYVAIELRHAPFLLWIMDLSAKDPYYVTPILMGASMFLQQKMTPTTMDPAQAKMMLMLPVVFTFVFLSFPSGLVIYWLVNNVLSIAQQYHIHKDPGAGAGQGPPLKPVKKK
ncbi:MAG: membrane protein insertase YidC [Thermodesulfobacteriota bacterium]